MNDKNILKPSDDIDYKKLQNHQNASLLTHNNLSPRDPYDGQLDKNSEIRLRLAIIDNYESKREKGYDPLDIKNVINLNTGLVTLKWLDSSGGVMRPNEMGGEWIYNAENAQLNPEDRTLNEWYIQSRREMVQLTYPFMWSNDKNYCGINYIPPVGSIVIVGFKKLGLPIILGYLSNNYKTLYPVLKPGEISIKGYGNNYIHNRQSDKIDLTAWSEKGPDKYDIDDPHKTENKGNYKMWIRINANNGNINLIARDYGEITTFTGNAAIESLITISPNKIISSYNYGASVISQEMIDGENIITNIVGESSITQTGSKITFNAKDIEFNSDNFIINNTKNINITNNDTLIIDSKIINITSIENYDITAKSSKIEINGELILNANLINETSQTELNMKSITTNINSDSNGGIINIGNINSSEVKIYSNNLIIDSSIANIHSNNLIIDGTINIGNSNENININANNLIIDAVSGNITFSDGRSL